MAFYKKISFKLIKKKGKEKKTSDISLKPAIEQIHAHNDNQFSHSHKKLLDD
jgi:hypothetical protein